MLDDAAPKLDLMKAEEDNKLFIHEHYKVQAFPEGHGKYAQNNPYTKICDNLIEAFNNYPDQMPYIIVILLGNVYAHDDVFVDYEFREFIANLLNRLEKVIQDKKDQMPKFAKAQKEPKVLFMRLLPKPAYALRNVEKFKATRKRANNIIESATTSRGMQFINADEINCSQKCLFTKQGHLSEDGFERMWVSISDAVLRIENDEALAFTRIGIKTKIAITQTPQPGQPLTPFDKESKRSDHYGHHQNQGVEQQMTNHHMNNSNHAHQGQNYQERTNSNTEFRGQGSHASRFQDRFHYYKR